MQRLFLIVLELVLFLAIASFYPHNIKSAPVTVTARVGDYVLGVSGFASFNASISAQVNSQNLASTNADDNGFFTISNLYLKREDKKLCFKTLDYKRIGESVGCMSLEGIQEDKNIDNIFLPPTIALSKNQIATNEKITIRGYSMPNITITIDIKDLQKVSTQTNSDGYYEYVFQTQKPGTYLLGTSATYNQIASITAESPVELKVLGPADVVTETVRDTIERLGPFGVIILISIIIIIIFFLFILFKRKRKDKEEKNLTLKPFVFNAKNKKK